MTETKLEQVNSVPNKPKAMSKAETIVEETWEVLLLIGKQRSMSLRTRNLSMTSKEKR